MLISILLICYEGFSQKKIVLDSITGKPLAFANILFDDGGVYSDANGKFEIPEEVDDGTKVYLSFLGYADKSLLKKNLPDTVYLLPTTELLGSVVITASKLEEIIKVKYSRSKESFIVNSQVELVSFIYPKEQIDAYLHSATFYFDKNSGMRNKEYYRDKHGMVRINIYKIDQNRLVEKIYSSTVYKLNLLDKQEIEIDFSGADLKFEREGFAFGIEYMGTVNKKGEIVDGSFLLRPFVTDKVNEFYEANSFLHFPLHTKTKLVPFEYRYGYKGEKSDAYNINFELGLAIE